MNHYLQHLISSGIAESRAHSLADAMGVLHAALAKMDNYNIRTFNKLYPGVAAAVNDYVQFNEGLAFVTTTSTTRCEEK